jgi:hypothetical protein
MLPIKKYIDSRFKSTDSKSDSNFYIDLPVNLLMPGNTGFYIDDVAIPVSWYTVEEGRNNDFYFKVGGVVSKKSIPSGNYSIISLSQELAVAMNSGYTNVFTAATDTRKNTIRIVGTTTTPFEILTDAQIKALNMDASSTINNILRTIEPKVHNNTNPYVSGFIDLFPIRNLYLTCSGLGNFNTMSISGDRSIF